MLHELDKMTKLLFQRVSIERLLTLDENKKVYFNRVNSDYLQELMLTYSKEFSDTERKMQIEEIMSQVTRNLGGLFPAQKSGTAHVFAVLFYYATELLTFHENQVVCKYRELLRWNELMKIIGEDLPVLSVIVRRGAEQGRGYRDFSWEPIIGHNNTQLNKILERGMADNHFHLRGSAPYFYFSWINLMNHPGGEFSVRLDRIEGDYRDKNKKSEVLIQRQPLYILVAEAALIRFYLFCRLSGWESIVTEKLIGIVALHGQGETMQDIVRRLLASPYLMEVSISALQIAINSMPLSANSDDYMLQYVKKQYQRDKEYQILTGERWFQYSMLKAMVVEKQKFTNEEYNWFYAYLRIKTEIRGELVQLNEITGFENFQIYQKRKDWFSHVGNWKKAEGNLARMAVRSILKNPAVKHLEVRISPEDTAYGNMVNIRGYDHAIIKPFYEEEAFLVMIREFLESEDIYSERAVDGDDLRERFHYVLHFTKQKDTPIGQIGIFECRHGEYRRKIERRAQEILHFRKIYPVYGQRVVGIDACSQEIGCRPEVFGKVFRTLKKYSYSYNDRLDRLILPQLKVSYHVGEEYLDIADGLRAIDEAIRFLNLDCGDRLGHAIALGVNAKEWYYFKNRQITISLQDYLDNIVWLHHALIRYRIGDTYSLKGWLEEEYSRYFPYIYQIKDHKLSVQGKFDLNTYYLSWLLRGDEPELYKEGAFPKLFKPVDLWDMYAVNKKHIRADDIRFIPEVASLYHMYHYSKGVRERGSEKKTFYIPDNYISGIIVIQKAMMEEIVDRGIAIETNPSSNVRIASFLSFENHPIKTFYNLGLTKNEEELMGCPQMNVSINTDDKGVFCTKLENEYALLACALEQEVTETGKHRYKREFIYEWLNNIREMGIRQTFSYENGEW